MQGFTFDLVNKKCFSPFPDFLVGIYEVIAHSSFIAFLLMPGKIILEKIPKSKMTIFVILCLLCAIDTYHVVCRS